MKPIPDGYTYTRCDQYTPDEFIKRHTDFRGKPRPICIEYMQDHPKKVYTTDDDIALVEILNERSVGSMMRLTGKNTTKRYKYEVV